MKIQKNDFVLSKLVKLDIKSMWESIILNFQG